MLQREAAQGLSKTQGVEGQRHLWEYVRVHTRRLFLFAWREKLGGGSLCSFFFPLNVKTGGRVLTWVTDDRPGWESWVTDPQCSAQTSLLATQ